VIVHGLDGYVDGDEFILSDDGFFFTDSIVGEYIRIDGLGKHKIKALINPTTIELYTTPGEEELVKKSFRIGGPLSVDAAKALGIFD